MVETLKQMGIGDPGHQDCRIDELESGYSILKCLEKTNLNIDDLDYLAKRLDSFCEGEGMQFQGMSYNLSLIHI